MHADDSRCAERLRPDGQAIGNGQPGASLAETLSDEEIEKLIAERAAAPARGQLRPLG